ncbi:MAG: hypothetical protein Q8R42_07835 [Desulfocapsaceae bacterium]|nr:hypothetical protein [Desulfocapsaceae bacterium]
MKNDAYIEAASKAMLTFQMIEEALKICIGLSYQIIQATVKSPVQYRFSVKSINNAAMGRLISMYEEITSTPELANDLRKITEWRNFFAHNAFRHALLASTDNSPFSQHSIEDVRRVVLFSAELVERLGKEVQKLQKVYKSVIGKDHDQSLESPT